jgi:uncharacterized protein YciI
VGDADLFERMNAPGRNRQIDRASADDIAFAGISAALVKIDFMSAAPQIRREQTTRETAADENKFCHALRIYESGNQESRKTEVASIDFASPIGLRLINRVQMKFFLLDVSIAMAGVLMFVQSLPGQELHPEKPKQFIYVLRLVPRLHADANWTAQDKEVLQRHFVRFQEAIKAGQLILAGRTSESGDKTFGIAVFQAKDEAAARKFMEEDPAVAGGSMTAELHPFTVALERKNP